MADGIEMKALKSRAIKAIGQDGDDLIVEFQSGGTYRYPGAAHHHEGLCGAESCGAHFHRHIAGQYKGARHQ